MRFFVSQRIFERLADEIAHVLFNGYAALGGIGADERSHLLAQIDGEFRHESMSLDKYNARAKLHERSAAHNYTKVRCDFLSRPGA